MILLRFKNNYTFTCAFLTACYTGMRTGEVLALTWDDIDLEKQIIKVNKTVYTKKRDEKGRWYLGTTKTEGSCRDVYICDTLKIALQNYQKNQENNKRLYKSKNRLQNKLVFTKKDGRYSGTDLLKYPFKIIHEELNIKNCRFYDLRGSFATKTLRSGIEIKDVSSVLGHSRVETTENYYISSNEETKKCANESFEQIVKSDIINTIIKYKY